MSHHNLAHGNKWVPNEMTAGSVNVPLKLYCKKVVDNKISNFQGKHLQSLFLIKLFLIKTSTQVFSCEICETLKHSYFEEHLPTNVSDALTEKVKFCSTLLPLALYNSCTIHKVHSSKKINGKIQTKSAELIYVWTNV